MAGKIIIEGISGYNGEYEFDPSYFVNKELHTIKKMAGVRAGEIQAAFAAGDNDLVVAFAAIALERNGKVLHEQVLWDAKVGCITFIGETSEEDEADPPTLGPEESLTVSNASSGPPLSDDSDLLANGQSRTGLRASELSAT